MSNKRISCTCVWPPRSNLEFSTSDFDIFLFDAHPFAVPLLDFPFSCNVVETANVLYHLPCFLLVPDILHPGLDLENFRVIMVLGSVYKSRFGPVSC